jgi:hypothetical protein
MLFAYWSEILDRSRAALSDRANMVKLKIVVGIYGVAVNETVAAVPIKNRLPLLLSQRSSLRHGPRSFNLRP